MNTSFHPAARKELLEAIAYYQAKGLEIGERLFTEVERRIRQAITLRFKLLPTQSLVFRKQKALTIMRAFLAPASGPV